MTTAQAVRAGRREWIGLAVLALACLLYVMDLTVLHLAVPALSEDLQPTSTQLLWIIDVYGFMVAGALVTMGTLGDRIGRRRLLLIGAAAFGAVSIMAAFSTTPEMLIVSRALLGIAGATIAPSTLSLIFHMFQDPKQRSLAVGIWIGAFSAGSAVGPVLGGLVLEVFWWGSVFLLALPVMGALLVLGPRVLPEYRDPNAGRLDLRSAAMSVVALLAIGRGRRNAVGAQAAAAHRTDDRPRPVPDPQVQRRARRELPGALRDDRLLPVHRAVSAAGRRDVTAARRPVVLAGGPRLRRELPARSANRGASWAERWVSRCWAASAPRSTAVAWPAACPPACRTRPHTPPATPSAGRSPRPRTFPTRPRPCWSTWRGRRSSQASRSRPPEPA
jgi:hypothetical protein